MKVAPDECPLSLLTATSILFRKVTECSNMFLSIRLLIHQYQALDKGQGFTLGSLELCEYSGFSSCIEGFLGDTQGLLWALLDEPSLTCKGPSP